MSVPISSFNTTAVSSNGRLTPVSRGAAIGARPTGSSPDSDTVVHLSEQARAILAGLVPTDVTAREQVTVFPARGDEADIQDAEFEPVLGVPTQDDGDSDVEALPGQPQSQPSETGNPPAGPGQKPRTPEQERAIQQLQSRDAEVRAHEAAHAAAAGSLGGRPSLEYVVGPDGKRYAVGGEVSVDTSPGRTPEETLAKARTIRAAATAPASPSAQDLAVAAAATRMEAEARNAIRERHQVENRAQTERSDQPDEIRRVDWAKVGESGPGGSVNQASPTAAIAKSAPSAEASAALAMPDPEMMMMQLVREQSAARGGMGHAHLSSGCGFCRRAAATYAY